MLSSIFIDRPRLAVVISIVITVAGLVALFQIPIAQFPNIVPPQINVIDQLKRVPGVGDVSLFSPSDYSMKVWLNTDRLTSFGLVPGDIANALKAQNIQAAVGRIGAQPALPDQQFQLNIQTKGRLSSVEEFGAIVVRANAE